MSTPHNQANIGDIAKVVLMPGDPLRAKFVAETFLENPIQFNTVRNMFGFTGTYKGKKVSVMGSGMGCPSIGIYSYELFDQYGVESIIRIGSAGVFAEDIAMNEVCVGTSSYSESTFANTMSGYEGNVTYPSEELCQKLKKAAEDLNIPLHECGIYSSDVFYGLRNEELMKEAAKHGAKVCEMESFALFHVARVLGKKAAAMVTVSDSLITKEALSSEDRQTSFTNMMSIALEAAIAE